MNGEDILNKIIGCIMDAIEEFFSVLTIPTLKVTRDALVVSVLFLVASTAASFAKLPMFISWQEALTATVILIGIVLIDSSSRKSIKDNITKLKDVAISKVTQSHYIEEVEGDYDEPTE